MPTERLDRNRVVKTAIDLLDEVGLDGLTLRRLAQRLGVKAPALYWHFKNKDELLHQMAADIALETPARPLEPGESWDDWLSRHAWDMRAALNRHRDGAMLAASTRADPEQFNDIEMRIGVLCRTGIGPAEAWRAFIAIRTFVSGFTLDEQADRARGETSRPPDPEPWNAMTERMRPYPLTREALLEIGDPHSDAAFEAGLRIIIDGIRALIDRTAA